MTVAIDPVAADAAEFAGLCERDRVALARGVVRVWQDVELGSAVLGREWAHTARLLGGLVTADHIYCRLTPIQRFAVDLSAAEVARCGHCGCRLELEREIERLLCTDCELEFIDDVERELDEEDED